MPYKLGKHASCPASKPFSVEKEDGTVVPGGCHPTRGKALAHQRALMANVPDANAELLKSLADDGPLEPQSPQDHLQSVLDAQQT